MSIIIECPLCGYIPTKDDIWACNCGNEWNTFDTKGKCPDCQFQWEETYCPNCSEMSPEEKWYHEIKEKKFSLFSNNKNTCPVDEHTRYWIESLMLWLIDMFGIDIIKKDILTPSHYDFPIVYNGEYQTAIDTIEIISKQMEINPDEIHLDIYSEGQTHVETGGIFGEKIFIQKLKEDKFSSGLYWGKQEDEKFHIALNTEHLTEPIEMVAVLAHEMAHIKLLGEKKSAINNERLTDITTVFFGLGIFNANSSFQFKKQSDFWQTKTMGYLSPSEWAYSLALFAYIRSEESPDWINHLTKDLKSDFKKSEKFIKNNKEKILIDLHKF